jgi:hypothetical protein
VQCLTRTTVDYIKIASCNLVKQRTSELRILVTLVAATTFVGILSFSHLNEAYETSRAKACTTNQHFSLKNHCSQLYS